MSHTSGGVLWLSLTLVACGSVGCEKVRHFRDHKTVLERVRASKPGKVSPRDFRVHQALDKTKAVAVSFAGRRFLIPRRTDAISRYPCSGCHTKPVAARKDGSLPSGHAFLATHGSAHLKLKHAKAGVLRCNSCHDSKDLQRLKTPTGESVSLDHSYKLCASCHQSQAKDWAGGAHGKRVKRWYGKRAIYTCTQCHNPHQPLARYGKRWPKAYFTLPTQRVRTRPSKRTTR